MSSNPGCKVWALTQRLVLLQIEIVLFGTSEKAVAHCTDGHLEDGEDLVGNSPLLLDLWHLILKILLAHDDCVVHKPVGTTVISSI